MKRLDVENERIIRLLFWNLDWAQSPAFYLVVVVLFLAFGELKISSSTQNSDHEITEIAIIHPLLHLAFGCSLLFLWSLLLVARFTSATGTRSRWRKMGLAICFLLAPFCLLRHLGNNLDPWTILDRVLDEHGNTYVFANSSFLQGKDEVVGKLSRSGPFRSVYTVLVGDRTRNIERWAFVIRPESSTSRRQRHLYLKHGYLIGISWKNSCHLAYELDRTKVWGDGDMAKLSPFVCLSDEDVPNMEDVDAICRYIKGQTDNYISGNNKWLALEILNGRLQSGFPSIAELRRHISEKTPFAPLSEKILKCYDEACERIRERFSISQNGT